jgi:ABC-type branched-subunit amino acid transport system permease subunit
VVAISALAALATLKMSGIYIMVLTLALQFTIERTFFAERKLTGGLTPLFTPRPEFLGIELTSDKAFYFFTLAVLGICMLMLHRLRHSRYGRSLLLVGANRQAAASVGVSPFRYKLMAFCIGGFFAGMAGALSAPLYNTPPNSLQFFVFQSLFFLAVPVVAGFESLTAVLAVALLFQLLPQALEPFGIDALVLGGVGLVVGTLAGPRGLGGNMKDLALGLAARKSRKDTAAAEGQLAHAGAPNQS